MSKWSLILFALRIKETSEVTLVKQKNNRCHGLGPDAFRDICIVALPWADTIGTAGTSTDIAMFERIHGVKVGVVHSTRCLE